jgi:selenide,water dikinase
MVRASHVAVELDLEAIPVLAGARETLQKGIVSSLQPENLRVSRYISNLDRGIDRPNFPVLFDPQTSGGLLATIAAERVNSCLASLKALGYQQSCAIGRVLHLREDTRPVTFLNKDVERSPHPSFTTDERLG